MMTTPILNVEHLSISYSVDGQWIPAVRDFSVQVDAGQIHGIVGESGSGKSTVAQGILRYLSANGRIEPQSKIELLGEDITQYSRTRMRRLWGTRVKMVPQNPAAALNPSMRVGAQVAEVLRFNQKLNKTDAEAKVIEMFRKVQLVDPESVAGRYPHELSGGMQQRIVIALALITDPEVLILDEPTTGLDVTTEAVILDLIKTLISGDRAAAALYITHNLGVVAQVCDSLTILYGGDVMADGDVKTVFDSPVHPYTNGLLNSIPRVGQTKYQNALQTINGHPPSLKQLPSGCVFCERCSVAIDKCETDKPPLESLPDGRSMRCHRWQEIVSGELDLTPDVQRGTERPPDRENLVRVNGIAKHFPVPRSVQDWIQRTTPPPVRAVDGVNLSIQKGRTLGLVGESGSGKTTLSRVIIGLQDRTDGTLELLGMEIRNNVRQRSKDVLAKIQMVFQNPQESLNPYLTVGQALRRPLMKLNGLGRDEADQRVRQLLEDVNLRAEYFDRYPGELSGGEKQRVVIARAFASDPDFVIADEPVSALDVSVQSAVLNLLARLQAENEAAYLFISHDFAVVGYLADFIAVMYLGQIMEVGYAEDMFQPPHHPYTEALISAIPVPDPNHRTEAIHLQGDVPSARAVPSGCRFHTRCPHKIGDICEQETPPWQTLENGGAIRCHISLEDLTALQQNPVTEEG